MARWAGLLGGRRKRAAGRSLRAALGDPGLRVAYWAPTQESYVDEDGPTTSATPGPDERVTTVTRRGERIARIVHGRRVDGTRLDRAFGPALRLALENEQLRAAALAELDELTRSRTRVVERAAVERRRLERNLHDGAQQRAVTLALLVRLLPAQTPAEHEARPGRDLDPHLDRGAASGGPWHLPSGTHRRRAARCGRGRRRGLDRAAGGRGEFPDGRYPGTVESTAYLVVHDALTGARNRGATCAKVSGRHADGALRICVQDDAAGGHRSAPPPSLPTR